MKYNKIIMILFLLCMNLACTKKEDRPMDTFINSYDAKNTVIIVPELDRISYRTKGDLEKMYHDGMERNCSKNQLETDMDIYLAHELSMFDSMYQFLKSLQYQPTDETSLGQFIFSLEIEEDHYDHTKNPLLSFYDNDIVKLRLDDTYYYYKIDAEKSIEIKDSIINLNTQYYIDHYPCWIG